MTLFFHEMRQGRMSLAVWSLTITFFMVACVIIYPEMEGDMEEMGQMFASMGSFTQAFGMDRLNFGTFMGFYCIECGNVLGLGGAFFAALVGIAVLEKEEKNHTGEFLLTHPVNRSYVVASKLSAVMAEIIFLNLVVALGATISIFAIGAEPQWKELLLIHLAYLLMQIEIGALCFGISAFVRSGGTGIGLGIAVAMYFFNLIKNLSDSADFLRYITPFAYTDGADIVENSALDMPLVIIGMATACVAVAIGFGKYCNKDIA